MAAGVVTIPMMKQRGLQAARRRGDRGGGLDRRAIDAAGHGRRRLHHGRAPRQSPTRRSRSRRRFRRSSTTSRCSSRPTSRRQERHRGGARGRDPAARGACWPRAGTSSCRSRCSSSGCSGSTRARRCAALYASVALIACALAGLSRQADAPRRHARGADRDRRAARSIS